MTQSYCRIGGLPSVRGGQVSVLLRVGSRRGLADTLSCIASGLPVDRGHAGC